MPETKEVEAVEEIEPLIILPDYNNYPLIEDGGIRRIRNAAIRINRTIYLVGSRASGTYHADSDFDYLIPGLKSREWQKIKNSLPGARSRRDDLPNRIELIRLDIDLERPHYKVEPINL